MLNVKALLDGEGRRMGRDDREKGRLWRLTQGRLRRPGLAAAGAGLTVVIAQAAGNAQGMAFDKGAAAGALAAVLVILGIVALVYIVWNTILAWIASNIMALPEATFGRALKFTIVSAIAGVCMAVLGVVVAAGIMGLSLQGMLGEEGEAVPAVVLIGALGFFVLWLLVAILVAAWVYRVGFLRAFLFLIVLWIVNLLAGAGLRAAGCVSTPQLPSDIPGVERPSPRGEPA
jgi:hypothetical protein